jgi:hypothetical protein
VLWRSHVAGDAVPLDEERVSAAADPNAGTVAEIPR